ncbi:hypothetical protein CISG_02345 [Coccidioides immitis RMSCC 3703]|nr:hypothetical protein CIRG_05985 [Coccidioides immitis RMSCC 2394]KMU80494.1 hypothetical protein CISG_02345 [Coccidioides immitis RMSCC 3703]
MSGFCWSENPTFPRSHTWRMTSIRVLHCGPARHRRRINSGRDIIPSGPTWARFVGVLDGARQVDLVVKHAIAMNQERDVFESIEHNAEDAPPQPRKRYANVYDAVAGRVSTQEFRLAPSLDSRNSLPSTFHSVPPDEVLFRRLSAPTRYQEDDIYFANERLPPDQTLPDSDLLKAIHTYASDFYSSATADRGRSTWLSMDETALIAMGILLEETAVEALGETGDMVFVEGEEVVGTDEPGYESEISITSGRRSVPSTLGFSGAGRTRTTGVGRSGDELVGMKRKKRRLSKSGRAKDDAVQTDGEDI